MPRVRKAVGSPDKHQDEFMQLGLTISYYRKMKGYSQGQLAERVGCSHTHISNIEAPRMKTSVSLESLFDIADALDVPVSKLFETK
jgi:transcriptional regulator with XRE-family HTH domain